MDITELFDCGMVPQCRIACSAPHSLSPIFTGRVMPFQSAGFGPVYIELEQSHPAA
jgi:hypothetical protein